MFILFLMRAKLIYLYYSFHYPRLYKYSRNSYLSLLTLFLTGLGYFNISFHPYALWCLLLQVAQALQIPNVSFKTKLSSWSLFTFDPFCLPDGQGGPVSMSSHPSYPWIVSECKVYLTFVIGSMSSSWISCTEKYLS